LFTNGESLEQKEIKEMREELSNNEKKDEVELIVFNKIEK